MYQQYRQCEHYVTIVRFWVTIVAADKPVLNITITQQLLP